MLTRAREAQLGSGARAAKRDLGPPVRGEAGGGEGVAAFLPLEDRCFGFSAPPAVAAAPGAAAPETVERYSVCPFANATRSDARGGAPSSLGAWAGWDEGRARGEARTDYTLMRFVGGAPCAARGGARARAASELRARLACSIDERLVAVDEVAPCEYEATLETPLACYAPEPLEAALDALRAHGVEPGASRALTLAAVDAALADRAAERETAEA